MRDHSDGSEVSKNRGNDPGRGKLLVAPKAFAIAVHNQMIRVVCKEPGERRTAASILTAAHNLASYGGLLKPPVTSRTVPC